MEMEKIRWVWTILCIHMTKQGLNIIIIQAPDMMRAQRRRPIEGERQEKLNYNPPAILNDGKVQRLLFHCIYGASFSTQRSGLFVAANAAATAAVNANV